MTDRINKSLIVLGLGVIILASLYAFLHKKAQWLPIKTGPIVTAVYGLGTVTSDHIYQLKSGVTNSVTEVYVHEGQKIEKGQSLIRYHDGQIVRAPFNGTITSLPTHDHEVVDQQASILTLMDLKHRYLLVSLDQDSAIDVKVGLPVKINFEALNGPAFYGKVKTVYPSNNNFYVRIDLDNLPTSILPEMTGDVAIILKTIPNGVQVPVAALQGHQLTLRINKKVKTVKVSVGKADSNWVQITSNNVPKNAYVKVSS